MVGEKNVVHQCLEFGVQGVQVLSMLEAGVGPDHNQRLKFRVKFGLNRAREL